MRPMRKKTIFFALLMAFSALIVVGCGSGKSLTLATGANSGTYYPIGKAMAEIINDAKVGVNVTAQSSSGSVSNINLLKNGQADLAIVQSDIAYYAMSGTQMYQGNVVGNIQGLAELYPESCQFVVRRDSSLHSLEDVRGMRVAVGVEDSGSEINVRQILSVHGIDYDDIEPVYVYFAEGMLELQQGKVDVVCLTAGCPTPVVQNVAKQTDIRLLPVEHDKAKELMERFPFYAEVVIPPGTYNGLTEETNTVAVMAMLACSDKIDEKTGYDISKALFTNLPKLKETHAVGEKISLENAQRGMVNGMSLTINQGAEKFFAEQKK